MKTYLITRKLGVVECHVLTDGGGYPLRHVVRHSPDGFEFGYGGSGPADLALSILMDFAGKDMADWCYQGFKWEFIASLPHQGGEISGETVHAYLEARKAEARQ